MSSTGSTMLAGPPSVIAQASLESGAFQIAALSPARAAGSTRPTGSSAPGNAQPGTQAEDVAPIIERRPKKIGYRKCVGPRTLTA